MQFPSPIIKGTLIKRYKRFLADVRLADGSEITAHCPNSGSMMGLKEPGCGVWLTKSDVKTRKHAHTLEIIEAADGTLAGINTGRPNGIVAEGIENHAIEGLEGYESLRREVKYGVNSRIDILLESPDRPICYVEVKNVHLIREAGLAEFPDSVTSRGAKHLNELAAMAAEGHRAVMVFLVHRTGCERFKLADDIDPAYAAAYLEATAKGVEAIAMTTDISEAGVVVSGRIPITAPVLNEPVSAI